MPQLTPPARFLVFRSPVACGPALVRVASRAWPALRRHRRQRSSPQALPSLPAPLRPSSGTKDSEPPHACGTSRQCSRSSALPEESPTSLPHCASPALCDPCCLLFGGPYPTRRRCPVLEGCNTAGISSLHPTGAAMASPSRTDSLSALPILLLITCLWLPSPTLIPNIETLMGISPTCEP